MCSLPRLADTLKCMSISLSIQIDSDTLKEPNVPTLENHLAAEVHAAHHISFYSGQSFICLALSLRLQMHYIIILVCPFSP